MKTTTTKKDMFTIQKYRISYVKETTRFDIDRRTIRNSDDVKTAAMMFLADCPIENFCIFALDNAHRIIGMSTITGDSEQCAVYIKNVLRFLLSSSASAFVIAHNHPGGNTTPSAPDWLVVRKLREAGKLLDIDFLDSLIIADENCVSMRDCKEWS